MLQELLACIVLSSSVAVSLQRTFNEKAATWSVFSRWEKFYFRLAVLLQKGWPTYLGHICLRSLALDRSVVWTQVDAQTHV